MGCYRKKGRPKTVSGIEWDLQDWDLPNEWFHYGVTGHGGIDHSIGNHNCGPTNTGAPLWGWIRKGLGGKIPWGTAPRNLLLLIEA